MDKKTLELQILGIKKQKTKANWYIAFSKVRDIP